MLDFEQIIWYNLVWGTLRFINREAVYEKRKLFQTIPKIEQNPYDLISTTKFQGTIWFYRWWMNMLVSSQYQPRLSSITNVAPGDSANQIALFPSN